MFTEQLIHLVSGLQWVQMLEEVHLRQSWLHFLHTFASVGGAKFTEANAVTPAQTDG